MQEVAANESPANQLTMLGQRNAPPPPLVLAVHTKLSVRQLRELVAARLTLDAPPTVDADHLSDSNQSLKSLANLSNWTSNRGGESSHELNSTRQGCACEPASRAPPTRSESKKKTRRPYIQEEVLEHTVY